MKDEGEEISCLRVEVDYFTDVRPLFFPFPYASLPPALVVQAAPAAIVYGGRSFPSRN